MDLTLVSHQLAPLWNKGKVCHIAQVKMETEKTQEQSMQASTSGLGALVHEAKEQENRPTAAPPFSPTYHGPAIVWPLRPQQLQRVLKAKERNKRKYAKKQQVRQNSAIVCLAGVSKTWPAHLLLKAPHFDPSKEFELHCTAGAKVAHFLPGFLPAEVAELAWKAIADLEVLVKPSWLQNTRTENGKARQLHFGQWRRSTEVEKTQEQTAVSRKSEPLVRQWHQHLMPLWELVRKALKKTVPFFYRLLSAVEKKQHWSFAGYSVCTVNFNTGAMRQHVDDKDHHDALCVVVPLGKYTGGQLVLHFGEDAIVVPVQPCDVLVMRGAALPHSVTGYTGDRYSLVLHTCHNLFRDMLPAAAQHFSAS
jgi:hypothetical protein